MDQKSIYIFSNHTMQTIQRRARCGNASENVFSEMPSVTVEVRRASLEYYRDNRSEYRVCYDPGPVDASF